MTAGADVERSPAEAAGGTGRRDLVVSLAVIAALALLTYGYLCAPGKTLYSPHSDFVSEHLSTQQMLHDSLQQGRGLPLWRSDKFSGYAGLISPQSRYTFPLQVLFFFLPPLAAVGATFFLYFVAAGLGYYLLARVLGLDFWPRLLMATAGMFSFKLIIGAYAGWLPNLPTVVCLPLLFAASLHAIKSPGLPSALALAAAGGVCLHAGHLQLFYYSFWFLLAYLIAHEITTRRERQATSMPVRLLWLVLGGALALGLAAYLIWPLAAESSLISRSRTSYPLFLAYHAITPRHLLTFLYPEALGTPLDHSYAPQQPSADELWEDVGYFGLIPLLLAAAGAVLGWRRRPTRYLVVCLVVTVALSMDSLLLRLLYLMLPGFQLFRAPARFLFLTSLFGIALAGIGLQEILGGLSRRSPRRRFAAPLCVALLGLMTAEGIFYARRYLLMVPQHEALPATAYGPYLARDPALFRVAPVVRSTLNHGWAGPMGLQLISGNDSFSYQHYHVFFELLKWNAVRRPIAWAWYDIDRESLTPAPGGMALQLRYDMLDALNVKYLMSPIPLHFSAGEYELAETFRDQPVFGLYGKLAKARELFLYRNKHPLARVFWAGRVVPAADDSAAIRLVQDNDLALTAVAQGLAGGGGARDTRGSAVVTAAWGGHLAVQTESAAAGYLLISEVWHPGWRATLDGAPLPLYRTDYALLGAEIPAGSHRLAVDFRPLRWREALSVTGASLLILVGGVGAHLRRRRRGLAAAA